MGTRGCLVHTFPHTHAYTSTHTPHTPVQLFHKGGCWGGHVTLDTVPSLLAMADTRHLMWLLGNHCVLQGSWQRHPIPSPLEVGVQVTCPTRPEHRQLQGSHQDIHLPSSPPSLSLRVLLPHGDTHTNYPFSTVLSGSHGLCWSPC